MKPVLPALVLLLGLAGCGSNELPPAQTPPQDRPPGGLKGLSTGREVRDSVYLPVDRRVPPPRDYGLYSVLLARTADRNTLQLLAELFRTTGGAGEAAMERVNLNLILLPVKSASEAGRALAAAREQPTETAVALMQKHYDHGQAALLMASVCHPARGAAVMKVCGSQSPEGPLLVTAAQPLTGASPPGQPLLVVNLSGTPPEALREVLAAYRRQILRKDFGDRAELDGWRLLALNHLLDAARLLPGISKAYAASR